MAPAMTAVGVNSVDSVLSTVAVGEADVQELRIRINKKIILVLYEP